MVALIDGVVKLTLPESNAVPPVGAAYQSIVEPPGGVAVIGTVPVPHREAFPAVGAAGIAFTVAFVVAAALVHPFTVTVTE